MSGYLLLSEAGVRWRFGKAEEKLTLDCPADDDNASGCHLRPDAIERMGIPTVS
jgi:hypothetical protein